MNDKDLRTKKNSIVNLKGQQEKLANSSYGKMSTQCEPKQPPNISMHYKNEDTKKKEIRAKEAKEAKGCEYEVAEFN
jgi:hypothetical protein